MNIEKLKKSAMFNLSLSSKELFHSNFIDWLISVNKEEMSKVFFNLLGENIKISKCNREKNNFDLYIDCEDKTQIIIENKFKSIITENQLKKYNDKLKNNKSAKKVLLSLNSSDHEKNLVKKHGWIVINYNELCNELLKLNINNEYHQTLIQDYCSFINEISNYFSNREFLKNTVSDMHAEYKRLSEIRLHDIYQKILFNYVLRDLTQKLNEDKLDFIQGFDFSKKISLWQDFWRGTGLVSLNYTLNKESGEDDIFRLELQLQYDALKLMLIHKNPRDKLSEEFKENYFKIIENLSNSKYCRKQGQIYPKSRKKEYKKYGEKLIYKNIILDKDLDFTEITELFYNTFKKMIDFGEKIKQS
ncbi:MAG: PD-(D/E)XK nuclease family protein [Candidatus Woesearchaeota archaeon]